jgi:uncharacterized protein (DUF433 family)
MRSRIDAIPSGERRPPMELTSPPTIEIIRDPEVRGGAPTLAGTRMGVHDIVSHVQRNNGDMQRVVEDFPYLTVDVIEAVLIWYRDHQEEIDKILRQRREEYQRLLARTRARP